MRFIESSSKKLNGSWRKCFDVALDPEPKLYSSKIVSLILMKAGFLVAAFLFNNSIVNSFSGKIPPPKLPFGEGFFLLRFTRKQDRNLCNYIILFNFNTAFYLDMVEVASSSLVEPTIIFLVSPSDPDSS